MGDTKYDERKAILNDIDNSLKSTNYLKESPVLIPGQVKQLTGGVDFGRVQKTLGSNVNILADGISTKLGEQQSAWDKWGNFTAQVGAEVLGGTIEGIGYLGDLSGLIDTLDGDMNSFGNWFSDIGTSLKDSSRENFPIFGAHDMGNAGFWLSNGVSVASTLSLMIPAVGTIKGVGALGKAMGISSKLGKSTKAGMSILGNAVVSRHMENMMEASQTWEVTRDTALENGKSLDDANKIASTAASNLYKVNYALIAQDIFQYSLLAKGPKINQAITNNRLAAAVGKSKLSTLGNTAYPVLKDMVSEGLEEGAQFIFAEETQYSALSDAGVIPKEESSERYKKYSQNSELWTSMLFGALGAGIMQGVGAGLKKTNIPIFGGNKGEQEYLEKRIEHANNSYTKITEAAIQLQSAIENKDQKGIIEAESNLAFNTAYDAASLGNFDIATANINDLIQEIKDNNGEGYAPDFEDRLKGLQKDMSVVADLYRKNSRKYAPSTVRGITSMQFNNIRLNKQLQESATKLSSAKENFPRYNNLSSTGQEVFDVLTEIEALKQTKAMSVKQAESIGTEEAKASNELFIKELDSSIEELKNRRKNILEKQKKDIDNQEQGPLVANRVNIAKRDSKILDGFLENGADVIEARRDEFVTDRIIDRNNNVLKQLTSKEGQSAIEKREEEEQKRIQKEEKEAAKSREEVKKNKIDDSVNRSKENIENSNPAKEEKSTESKKEEVKEKPKPKLENSLSKLTDAQLDEVSRRVESEADLANVKAEMKRRADEKLGKIKEKEQKFDKKVSEHADIIAINSENNAPTPENIDLQLDEEELSEKFDPISETGYSLAWLSTSKLSDLEIGTETNDPQMAQLVTNYFENPDISLRSHYLEFFIDEKELEKARTYKKSDVLRELVDKLDKGEDIGNIIGMLPVKAYLIGADGNRVNLEERDLEIPIHDITFDGWNYLDADKADAARSELVELKTKILENKGKTLVSPITTQRGGIPYNSDNFVNAAEALNTTTDDIQLVIGSKAIPGTVSGQYVNASKEPVDNLDHLESATPGAVYAATKRPNGEIFPVRLWVSKLEEQEAELVYKLYELTLQDADAYRSVLNNYPELLKFIQNSNDNRVSGILEFVDPKKSTVRDLLSMLVYQGNHTKTMGKGTLLSSSSMVKVGNSTFSKESFLSPEGKTKFKERLLDKMRQIPNELIEDNKFKKYVIDNGILTANFEPGKPNFVQPTVIFGEAKIKPVEKKSTKEISEEEYSNFIDNGIVTEDRINSLAQKVKNNETLSERELSIFNDKTSEVNEKLQEIQSKEGKTSVTAAKLKEVNNRQESIATSKLNVNEVVNEAENSGTSINLTEKIKDKQAIADIKSKLASKLGAATRLGAPVEENKYEDESYDDDALSPFKVREVTDSSKPLTKEEVNKVAKIVPKDVAIEMTEDYITLLSGGRAAVGLFTSGLIKLSVKAKAGDAFHEAFHAVFRTSLSETKRMDTLNEAKNLFLGPLEQDINLLQATHNISRESAIDLFYEEQLADEFALYANNPEAYKFAPNSNKVKGLFSKIMEWIKSVLHKPANYKSLFENILNGNYNSSKNVDTYIAAGSVASIDNITNKPC